MTNRILDVSAELPEKLLELHWAFRASRVLHVAVRMGVFEALSRGAKPTAEVASEVHADAVMLEKLLICCCAMGLTDRDRQGHYCLTDTGRTYFTRDAPLYQGDVVAHSSDLWDWWDGLEAVVRTGSHDAAEASPRTDRHAWNHEAFINAMHNLAVTGPARMIAQAVDLSGRRRLLDVGGGPGTYSIALCERYPQLTATVFDRPETLALTKGFIERHGMADRVHVEEGDWDQPSYGSGYDAALLSNILHGPNYGAHEKLRKTASALRPSGLLIVQDLLLNDDKTGPLTVALFNVMVGAYSTGEMLRVIEESGFAGPEVVASGDRGNDVITAVRA